jgi:MFS family permease
VVVHPGSGPPDATSLLASALTTCRSLCLHGWVNGSSNASFELSGTDEGSNTYPLIREHLPPEASTASRPWAWLSLPRVGRTVVYLGLTSLFTDISSEMVSTVLPLYLVLYLGFSPLQFGVVDGLYQGVSALVRLAGGVASDRWRRHKEVAAAGYALSALCKLGLLAAGGAGALLGAIILLDRTGKGVRTAPRDAMISLSSRPGELATAFGVHRALDTAGAMLGPLATVGLLTVAPTGFDAVFVASFCAAVENRPPGTEVSPRRVASIKNSVSLLAAPRFRALTLVATALTLATISDAFVYLTLQRHMSFSVGLFPLLYVGTALVYLLLAVPVGRLADRVGRQPVFIGGYLLLPLLYVALLQPTIGLLELFGCLSVFGAYYAATDGVLMALGSASLPTELRTSGLALLTTATSLGRLVASVVFGALWTWWGPQNAVSVFLIGLLAVTLLAWLALARSHVSIPDELAAAQ